MLNGSLSWASPREWACPTPYAPQGNFVLHTSDLKLKGTAPLLGLPWQFTAWQKALTLARRVGLGL